MFAFAFLPVCSAKPRRARTSSSCCEQKQSSVTRRHALALFCSSAIAAVLHQSPSNANAADTNNETNPTKGFLTKSGLKYVDFQVGTGERPSWGNYVLIHYVAYTISPDGKSLQKEHSTYDDRTDGFLIHHGNGEMILGVEEAIHSMQVGGKRRAIIPPILSYIDFDLGPVFPYARERRRFRDHLKGGDGTVVFDIELLRVMEDPIDRGYYEDVQLESEEEEIELAQRAAAEYAEECRKAGVEPPDPKAPYTPYALGDDRIFPYSPYVAPGLPRPNTPKKKFSIVY